MQEWRRWMPDTPAYDKLSPQYRRFVDEYLVDYKGSRAATRAGFSKKTARSQASRLLTRDDIQAALAEKAKKIELKLELTAERVLLELARICYADKRKLFKNGRLLKPHEWDDHTAAAVAAVDFENKRVRMHPKNEALNMAGRYLKLFKEDAPMQPQAGMYVLLAPATATPDEWNTIIQQHARAGT